MCCDNTKITVRGQGDYAWGETIFCEPLANSWTIIKFITNHQKPLARYRAIAVDSETWGGSGQPEGGTELLKYGETRYTSRILMGRRLRNVKDAVEQLIEDGAYKNWLSRQISSVQESGAGVKRLVQADGFWSSLDLAVRLLEPVVNVLQLSDGKKGATLGQLYQQMINLDNLYKHNINGFPTPIQKKMHKIFTARWQYFHTPIFSAAYVAHPEFMQVNHSTADEASFRKVLKAMANEEHSYNKMNVQWSQLKTAISTDSYGLNDDEAFSMESQKLQPFEWVRSYLYPWPDLCWALMRLAALQCSASACEHSWSVEGWIHSKKCNHLGQKNVERLVRAHTNLILEAVLEDWEAHVLPWDIELVIEEPEEVEEEE